MKIKKLAGAIFASSLVATSSILAYGTLTLKMKDDQTFGHYGISQFLLQVWCGEYSFSHDKKEIGVMESIGSPNIALLKKTNVPLNCQATGKTSYHDYRPTSVELQVKYEDGIIRCGKYRLENPNNREHQGEISEFSSSDEKCSWSVK